MNKYAVIVAGGAGTRMGGATPKQFILVNNKPVLYYSLQTFLNAFADIQIILVLPVDYTDMGQENFSVVHVIAEDQPFTDSTVKQIAAFVADHMQENIMVSKAGKSGLNVWTIPSPT